MRAQPTREGRGRGSSPFRKWDVIGSWERKKCDWLFFTVSKGKRDSGVKQPVSGKAQGSGSGGSGYSGVREKTGYGNRTWSAGDKYGVDRRGGSGYDR